MAPGASAQTIVHGPRLGLVTGTEATIYWDTDQAAIGQVKWGASTAYSNSQQDTRRESDIHGK